MLNWIQFEYFWVKILKVINDVNINTDLLSMDRSESLLGSENYNNFNDIHSLSTEFSKYLI